MAETGTSSTIEERPGNLSAGASGESARSRFKSPNYGNAEFLDREMRLTDLIPRRWFVYVLLILAGVVCIAGIEQLHAWSTATDGAGHSMAAFRLDGKASLCVWFSSATLQLAGLVAILVYRIRRNRLDDYRGQYRIWLWAAACWFLMSADETAQLHVALKDAMIALTGAPLAGDGSIWWILFYSLVLGVIGLRLLLDMRECRLSFAVLLLVAVANVGAVLTHVGVLSFEPDVPHAMLEQGLQMTGDFLLLLAMMLHARHVTLDAEGLLPKREKKVREPKKTEAKEKAKEKPAEKTADKSASEPTARQPGWKTADPAHPTPPAPAAKPAMMPAAKSPEPVFTPADDDSDIPPNHLSKAERKAWRRRLEEQKRQRDGKR